MIGVFKDLLKRLKPCGSLALGCGGGVAPDPCS